MRYLKKLTRDLFRREEGASIIEYALLVSLIAVVAIAALILVGTRVSAIFTQIAGQL